MKMYKQCYMEKQVTPTKKQPHVAWIPSKYAKVGKVLRLKFGEDWIPGFMVKRVWGARTEDDVLKHRNDYNHHREATDV